MDANSPTALKKKFNKNGEDSRYQGTLLGKEADLGPVTIVGGSVGSIHEWNNQVKSKIVSRHMSSPLSSTFSSVPVTPMDDAFGTD